LSRKTYAGLNYHDRRTGSEGNDLTAFLSSLRYTVSSSIRSMADTGIVTSFRPTGALPSKCGLTAGSVQALGLCA
jgi:hypothetical protein